ncbi:sugar phosphate isomerase/epimerase family protein [Streptomyces sp. NY05-11A]|uniref:sugar phosphate isomerase/epimerase family protein n=1 Tax=Streptomyces soliscabiei TaxID=588897 RepID=UPI0029A47145|nr:sugar phosphate isomerase/epimerase family protein [Streptomyces sp. NY05-11A]MDX2675217.1 sugar phosphate isomerase/epimerase [Streptomyces sp. NY05-11A]
MSFEHANLEHANLEHTNLEHGSRERADRGNAPRQDAPQENRPRRTARHPHPLSPVPDVSSPPPPPPSPPLRFGYGTNGLADLRLDDALDLLADLGYDGVGLTLDHMHLDPFAPDLGTRTRRVAHRLDTLGLGVTVETGARYVLDPRRKHGPSLLDPDPDDRARRVDLLLRAVRIAGDLGAHAVHCFSGTLPTGTHPDTHPDMAWQRLAETLTPVLDAAATADIPLAIEPEPGHLLATLADFHRLRRTLGDPASLGLTLDIGHCQCLEPLPPADCVRAAAPWLRHVQIEDMRRDVHEHLPFGDGEIDFPPVLAALAATGYRGLTVVELPRHSHAGPQYAELSLPFLRRAQAAARAVEHADPRPSSRLAPADRPAGRPQPPSHAVLPSLPSPAANPSVAPPGEPSATPEGSTP